MPNQFVQNSEQAVVLAVKEIVKKYKNLRSLGPTKRPIILNKLKQRGYKVSSLDLTKIINTHFKN